MNILVSLDLSESAEKVITAATNLAKAMSSELYLIHVAEPEPDFIGYGVGPQTVRESVSKELHKEHAQIQEISERIRQNGIKATGLLLQGSIVETILKQAKKLDVEMIVMGTHGRGAVFKLLVGSVSEGVLRGAKCPVLVVPTHNRD
jgi:nucleotide-binding universal stress UspA family protein